MIPNHNFEPAYWLRNRHAMTIAPHFLLRARFANSGIERVFQVDTQACVAACCHWQLDPKRRATVIVLHGLEGSANSHYVIGIARKAFQLGMNVVRMNMRNCGGDLRLSQGLYNSGMSGDVITVIKELA